MKGLRHGGQTFDDVLLPHTLISSQVEALVPAATQTQPAGQEGVTVPLGNVALVHIGGGGGGGGGSSGGGGAEQVVYVPEMSV